MKWVCLFLVVCGSAFCDTSLKHEISEAEDSFEERLKRLEQDTGIDVRPETMTVFFFGEFIYWKTSLDGVAYATTAKAEPGVGGGTVFNDFKTRTVHFDYSPAFQIGMGVGLPYDHWNITANWLRSFTTGSDTAHADLTAAAGNKVIFSGVGLIEELDSFPNKAKAQCKVHLDIVDLVLGRTFLWSRYFWFRPYGGIRGTWVRLDWDVSFTRPIAVPSTAPQSFTDFDVDNHYSAAGFVGGFDSRWNFHKGFGLFSRVSAALVYGNSSEKTKQKFFSVPAGQTATFEQSFTARNSLHAVKGMFDIAVGVKWEGNFYKKNHIFLWAGYDFFYWPNVTQKTIVQATRSRDRSDLSYEGLILGARLDF